MRQISSPSTFFHKRVFPAVWFGILGLLTVLGMTGAWRKGELFPGILVPVGLMVFGFILMYRLIWGLMDEVYFNNDIVVVRNGGDEDRFPVTNILNVNINQMNSPERITLLLRSPCKFGDKISFLLPTRWLRFSDNPIAAELIRLAHGLDDNVSK